MKRIKITLILLVMASLSAPMISQNSCAANYPNKTIQWIVPFKAGGGSDRWSRALSSVAFDVLNHGIRIKNIPGANAMAGWKYLLQKPADGYTVMISSPTPIIAMEREKNSPVKPDQIKIVCFISAFRALVLAPKNKPWSTWEGLLAYAKNNPNKLSLGSTLSEMIGASLVLKSSGAQVKYVPYSSASAAITDFLGGHIDLTAATESTALTLVPEKATAVINVTSLPLLKETSKKLGNPPHAAALGFKTINFPRWIGVHPDTPDEIVEILSQKIGEMLKQPSFKKIMKKMGEEIIFVPHNEAQNQYKKIVLSVKEVVSVLK